jgi:hypothetical protein
MEAGHRPLVGRSKCKLMSLCDAPVCNSLLEHAHVSLLRYVSCLLTSETSDQSVQYDCRPSLEFYWPRALARDGMLPDVLFEVLCSKPNLVPSEDTGSKETVEYSGVPKKCKHGDE